jgi:hypothetical protein
MAPAAQSSNVRYHPQWRLRSYVLDQRAFNDMRMRLPRAVRRGVEPAPDGHVGLILQATVCEEDETPLAVLYDNAPAPLEVERMREMEQHLAELLR